MAMQPFTLTDEQKAEVETLAAVLTAEQVADYFGIGRRTFYSMMQRDEEIAARYKRGKAKAIGVIAQGLINKARAGDTTSMIFFLKTQAGWRETSQVEHMLPAEPDISPDSAFQKLTAYLNAIASRTQAATLTAEPQAVPAEQSGGEDG
ncbi:helix-turn-helix domain-containing protein [Rhodobacter sp. SY28-1]|uniref:helix-turn-helix domain-containing protein n=1 Tax=Rhodobacter sp. SY28-1 TaxID=2562317 RepID=UPI0010BFC13B|nr:helix-turn-helix domain-containing protein [Rhodobacter sp. SY28-1]